MMEDGWFEVARARALFVTCEKRVIIIIIRC
jgi:hypothetical protein